jgi:tetratricopeptide (TPR) repeat protein
MYNSTKPQIINTSIVKSDSFWKNKKNVLFIAAILAISFIAYLPSLRNGFVNFDDQIYVYENPYIINISSWYDILEDLQEIFTTDVNGSYKPLTILSFAFEKIAFGLDSPQWWHLNNIILHLICVLLVFRIALALGLKIIPAAFCALLFGIHPMRVESVAWITERKDVLYGSFYLLALYYYIKSVKLSFKKRYVLIIHICFILSLLSKMTAVALPLSMLAVDYYFDRKLSMKLIYEKWFYFLLSLATGALGLYFMRAYGSLTSFNEHISFFKIRIFYGSYMYLLYLIKSLIPYKMVPFYPYPVSVNWLFYASMACAFIILGSTYYFFLKRKKEIVFGLLFFTFNIMFLLQFKIGGQGFSADRYTYIAYLGLFFIYAFGLQLVLEKLKKIDKLIYFAAILILGIYGYINFEQNKIWKNGGILWSHVLKYYTDYYNPWINRADYYANEGRLREALYDYNKAIVISPNEPYTYRNRGAVFLNSNQPEKALQDFNTAIMLSRGTSGYDFVARGIIYIKLNMFSNALQDFNSAERLDPSNQKIYYNRSKVYINLGQYNKAQLDLEKYVSLNPNNSNMWSNLGEASRLNKLYDKSLSAFNKAIQMDPDNLVYYYNRLTTYYEMGDIQRARNDLNFLKSKGFKGINPEYERMINQER